MFKLPTEPVPAVMAIEVPDSVELLVMVPVPVLFTESAVVAETAPVKESPFAVNEIPPTVEVSPAELRALSVVNDKLPTVPETARLAPLNVVLAIVLPPVLLNTIALLVVFNGPTVPLPPLMLIVAPLMSSVPTV